MLTMCWAVKGGSGTTVMSCALALLLSQTHETCWLVDLAGDVPAALGISEPASPGVRDWIASSAPTSAFDALGVAGADRLRVVARGSADVDPLDARWAVLAEHLARGDQPVVVDAGTGTLPPALLATAHQRLLVTRPCYLALRRAAGADIEPTGVVVVHEPGRALSAEDVAATLGTPVMAVVSVDPAVARAVDAGLLAARLPRTLSVSLRGMLR